MPTYGMEPPEPPRDLTPAERTKAIQTAVEAALRVRDNCGMDLNDEAVARLVTTALGEYR